MFRDAHFDGWHGLVLQAVEAARRLLGTPTAWSTRLCHPTRPFTRDRAPAYHHPRLGGAICKIAMPAHRRPGESLLIFLVGVSLACFWAGGCERGTDTSRSPRGEGKESPTRGATHSRPQFVDVAAEVGLAFEHVTGATGEFYFPEIMGSGCALFDYDSDGDLDVYAVQGSTLAAADHLDPNPIPSPPPGGPTNRLFRNDLHMEAGGAWVLSFTDVTEEAGVGDARFGMGCAVADFDNDGDADLFVTNVGPNVLYLNNGDGTFSDVTSAAGLGDVSWASSAAFFDYDGDGLLDLYVVNYVNFTVRDNKRCYTPAGARDYCNPVSYRPVGDILYHNRGDGTFENVTSFAGIADSTGSGLGVAGGDFDGDGWIDLYVANDGEPNHLWMNRGDGTFDNRALLAGAALNAVGEPEAGMGVAVADIDEDGDDDVFVSHLTGESNTLYRNDGNGWFHDDTESAGLASDSVPMTGFGAEWFDYDNDTYLDLFVANGAVRTLEHLSGDPYPYHQTNQLFRRTTNGPLDHVTAASCDALSLSEVSRGAAFGDIDNDGDVDILVSNNDGPLRLLRNETDSAASWMRLKLQGTTCNRDAVGARVTIELADGRTLHRRVHRDGSYASSSDIRVHVGLAGHTGSSVSVTVHWPDGRRERWDNVSVRKQTLLRQGEGIPIP